MAIESARRSAFDPKDFLGKAGTGRTVATYSKHEELFDQGEAADSVFYIRGGKVKVTVLSEQGKEAVIAILGEGEFCGEGCLGGQKYRDATAVAMTDCEATRLEKPTILRALKEEPTFSQIFVAHLLARATRVQADLVDQLFNSSEKRLARTLLLLANYGTEDVPDAVIPNVTHEMLAEMIGTTRSRVSFFMSKFRKLGFISHDGQLRVHKSLLNLVLHDQPHIRD